MGSNEIERLPNFGGQMVCSNWSNQVGSADRADSGDR